MEATAFLAARLASHRLSAPASTVAEAAAHMLATQAQEFWGGRLALAARTRGHPAMAEVDAAFDRGEIVRSWTMRGTIHIVPTRDLAWVLSVTGERQRRQAAAVHRREGIDDAEVSRAESIARERLRGGDRATRAELFAAFDAGGVGTRGQRGYHLLTQLSTRGVVCSGPVVPREGAPTREQFLVLVDEWAADAASPSDPAAELFARYIAAHGPAGVRDFAWWTGLPLGLSRAAAAAAAPRIRVVDESDGEPLFVASGDLPAADDAAPRVVALPPFEEYYLSYLDRTRVCAPEFAAAVGPSANGIVRPVLVADGTIVGVWAHSQAVGRHTDEPVAQLFARDDASDAEVAAALRRYREFLTGGANVILEDDAPPS